MSKPVRILHEEGLLLAGGTFMDYGCGRGEDIRRLQALGYLVHGWDPVFRPQGERVRSEAVNLGYVINVVEQPEERIATLQEAWELTERVLAVAARSSLDDGPENSSEAFGDGYLTRLGSFQKFYDQHELRMLIQEALGVDAFPAAPGIFLVFREESLRESWRARRFQRRIALPRISTRAKLYQEHEALLQPLMAFLTERGRLPNDDELPEARDICHHLGSLPRAFQVIRTVTGDGPWEDIQSSRRADLLVWLALSRFQVRPTFSGLPSFLQQDIKALFGAYTKACQEADALLMSLGKAQVREDAIARAPFGKLMPKGLYVQRRYLDSLPPILRLYEGCARALIGEVPTSNLVKFHRDGAQISYLTYQDFERDPHPELMDSVLVSLDGRRIKRRSYADHANRFILHRKETFLPKEDPAWERFHRLTVQEEKWGLYEFPAKIGTRLGWAAELRAKCCILRGHRLVRDRSIKEADS